jgi:hypothetical protein
MAATARRNEGSQALVERQVMSDRSFLDPGDEVAPEARIRAAEKAVELRRSMETEEKLARAEPGAVLKLVDGTECTMVKRGREAPPLTLIIRQGDGPEREIPLTDVALVL